MATETVLSPSAGYGTFRSGTFPPNAVDGHEILRERQSSNQNEPTKEDGTDDRASLTDNESVPLIDRREEKESTCEKYTLCRWVLTYLGFLLTLLFFLVRNCISMALVCINEVPNAGSLRKTSSTSANFSQSDVNSSISMDGPMYIPADQQGLVLSSYYYGYMVTPLFAGMLAERFGGKRVLAFSMGTAAALNLLTPTMIRLSVYLTVTFRILLGMAGGFCMPGIMAMMTIWAPPREKARLVAIVLSGTFVGTIMANFVSGFLCSIPFDEGWPFIFYTYGGMALLWTVLWQVIIYETPSRHPRISDKERNLYNQLVKNHTSSNHSMKTPRLPLKSFFTSPPCLALCYTSMVDSWVHCTNNTYTPLYISGALHFDTETSGALSALPPLAGVLFCPLFGALSDRLNTGGLLTQTNNRKLFQGIGSMGAAFLFLGLGFLDQELRTLAVFLIVALTGVLSAGFAGCVLNRLDVAPRFTGSVVGLTTVIGNTAQIVSPLIISDIISDNRPESWSTVFFITAGLGCSGAIIFGLFGSGQEQEWAKDKPLDIIIATSGKGGQSQAPDVAVISGDDSE